MTGRSYCCTRPSALCFWFALFFVFYGAGLIVIQLIPNLVDYQGTVLFLALGLACSANAVRNRSPDPVTIRESPRCWPASESVGF